MAWVTSCLCQDIELSLSSIMPKIKKGFTLIGDSAYVKAVYMAVPIKGAKTEVEDSYNFYQLQLRITIECAFGVLMHRWSIFRGPLNVPLFKVVPVVHALCKLHNYCINERLRKKQKGSLLGLTVDDAKHLNKLVSTSNRLRSPKSSKKKKNRKSTTRSTVVDFDTQGTPVDLLGGGEHFNECPPRRLDEIETNHPMDDMIKIVELNKLTRPTVN